MKINTIPVTVYRGKYDCTNHGISSKYDELLVACPDGHRVVDSDNLPENFAMVEARHLFGKVCYTIYPAGVDEKGNIVPRDGKWWMMGGNYAGTSDSRFSNMLDGFYGAVAIHDRYETQEEYEALSR